VSPRAILVGLPGSGKTSTGRRLAARLGVPFADSDALVESFTGRTVSDIFADDGEPAFRRLEATAIAAALRNFDGVLAVGGGAVTSAATRAALTRCDVPIVLLDTSLPTLARRVGDGATRPLLRHAPAQQLAELARDRTPLYQEVATMRVETDRRSAEQVAAAIAVLLTRVSR
jgi:shikimate kinase